MMSEREIQMLRDEISEQRSEELSERMATGISEDEGGEGDEGGDV